MLFDSDDRSTQAGQGHLRRCAEFGAAAAAQIRSAGNCRFSLLPQEELARLASSWYDASAKAMLHGNYSPIIAWTQRQAQLASEQGFSLHDVVELLRICRRGAIEREKWKEEIFCEVDEAINEALVSVSREVAWTTPPDLDYRGISKRQGARCAAEDLGDSQLAAPAALQESWLGDWSNDRRDFGRNRLRLPICVRIPGGLDEITHTHNVSRSGLYFITRRSSYAPNMALRITYPYWSHPGAINREYGAQIVRMDRLGDGLVGIAAEFTESLGS